MRLFRRHGRRIAVTLLPLVLALLHAMGALPMDVLQRLDHIIYDARLRATLPATLDERIVIVDIDEKSLAEVGRWPWSRHHLARLVDRLFDEQQVALLGFDTVFAEADESSGLRQLQALGRGPLADQRGFLQRVRALEAELDYDARLAQALQGRPVVLGYYFTSDREGRSSGQLPAAVMEAGALAGPFGATRWNGFGANLPALAATAPRAGFFNAITDSDGVVRSLPLLAEYEGRYYESLALAMYRHLLGMPRVEPGLPSGRWLWPGTRSIEHVRLTHPDSSLAIPVDERAAVLIPFRGAGGPRGGSFHYVSAADVLAGRLAPGQLQHKIVLVGTTAPGLLDLRVTPVSETYPGVETHASLLASLLDGDLMTRPGYALGYELLVMLVAGLLPAFALPLLSAGRAVALSLAVVASVAGLNTWLYHGHGLVLPLASTLVMVALAFVLNMSYGYLVESRAKRELARRFGTYVPPELVDEMVTNPERYGMEATTRELTVMFCDMRDFTRLSETMEPTQLQALLNRVFSRLTQVIRRQRGTVDKYMGDCVMAFWGAPVPTHLHASLAVQAALDMKAAMADINREHARDGLPAIGIGIGLSTGSMCVGDMGSDVRRSYTVVGDAVNLGARLEGLSCVYGVVVVASERTREQAPGFAWQELDRVRVKGKAASLTIHTPLGPAGELTAPQYAELRLWEQALQAWRGQDWDACDTHLLQLQRLDGQKFLYRLYAQRVASMRQSPPGPQWDGAIQHETK